MTSKDSNDWSLVVIVGAVFLIVVFAILLGLAFTTLFNAYFLPVFLPETAPLSWQQGTGLYIFIWLVLSQVSFKR